VGAGGRLASRELGWCCAYVAITLVGALTVPVGSGASLVWSGAGVVALWLAGASARTRTADLLSALTVVVLVDLVATGSVLTTSVLLAAHVAQVAVLVPSLRKTCGHLYGFGGDRAMTTPGEAIRFALLAAVSSAVGCGVGALGLLAARTDLEPVRLLAGAARSTAGLMIVLVVGSLLVRRAAELRGQVGWAPYRHSWRSPVEPVLLWSLSVAVLVLVFGPLSDAPLGFLLLSVTVLVAARLGPIGALAHAVLAGGVAILLSRTGEGPFTAVAGLEQRDLLVQVYGLASFVTALLVSFSQHDRAVVGARLEKLQRRTAAQARELGAVVEHLQEGLSVVGEGGRVVLGNPAGEQLLGHGRLRQLGGGALQDGEHPFERAARGESFQQDYQVEPLGDGEPVVVEVVGGPIPVDAAADRDVRGVVTYRDVTAQRHDRDALAAFAGVVAHDLKRPLTGIVGWTGLLAHEVSQGELDRAAWSTMLGRVSASAAGMTSLLDDLLTYTVVRDAPVRHEELDVSAVAEQAAEHFRARESQPQVSVEPGLAAVADPVLLRQVLDNLIGNAVKYVAPGVRPRVHVGGRVEGGETVLVVRDNGIGIAPDLRRRVFEAFQRAHGEDYRGTGLGLAIVRRAVERCDGTITVRDPGPDDVYPDGTVSLTGTVFELRLPAPVHAGSVAVAALLPPLDVEP
jgi:signal transduction histidine kinase